MTKTSKSDSLIRTQRLVNKAVLILTRLQHLKQNVDIEVIKKRTQKRHLWRHIKRPVLLHFGGREAGAGSAVVSSHWSGQRGESPMLHHSDGCVQLHYIWAAGSPGCRGRGSHCLAPLAKGLRPRLTGQGLVRTQAWLGLAGHRGAAVVSQMIYRGLGWREYWKDTF